MTSLLHKLVKLFRFTDSHYAVLIFIISLALYTVTLKGVYGNPPGQSIKNNLDKTTKPFELSPERDRYILILSLAENKSFALSQQLADAAYPDDGYYNGRFYIFFAPGISLFALPFYLLGHFFHLAQVASYFFVSLIASVTLVFLFKITRNMFKLPVWSSLAAPLIFAFGSTSWSYAVTLYQHHITTFFIIASFYAVWKYQQQKKMSWLWALFVWVNYALAILVDYPNAILMLPVMVYFFFASVRLIQNSASVTVSIRKGFLLTIIPFIILSVMHGYYNQVNFGSWKTLSGSLTGYKEIKENNLFQKVTGKQQIAQMALNKQPVNFFKEEAVTHGLYVVLVSDERGIFYYSPIFILAIFGILYALRRTTMETGILLSLAAVDILLYSSFDDPWGGYAFGSRYLIPAMAVLSLFIAQWLTVNAHHLYVRVFAFTLFVYSTAISLLGVLTTNALPPKVEADYLKIPHTYIWNFHFLMAGKSSSFLYNNVFSSRISLIGYYVVIYEVILSLAVLILFILPARKNHESYNTD